MQDGIDLCKKNIQNFLEDARLLVEHGRMNHAYVSVQFAIEELGKIVMLKESFENSKADPILVAWKVFRSHKAKSEKAWTVLDPRFKTIYDEGCFDDKFFDPSSFDTDTKAGHRTRLECAFVDFNGAWHIGRRMKRNLFIDLVNHIEEKLTQV